MALNGRFENYFMACGEHSHIVPTVTRFGNDLFEELKTEQSA